MTKIYKELEMNFAIAIRQYLFSQISLDFFEAKAMHL